MREFSVLKASIIFPSLYPTIDVFYRIVMKTHISMVMWGNFQYWKRSSYFQGYFWFLPYFTEHSKQPQMSMDFKGISIQKKSIIIPSLCLIIDVFYRIVIIVPSLYFIIDVFYQNVIKTQISMVIWGNFQYWKLPSYFQAYIS